MVKTGEADFVCTTITTAATKHEKRNVQIAQMLRGLPVSCEDKTHAHKNPT